jgi:hypothetical protein
MLTVKIERIFFVVGIHAQGAFGQGLVGLSFRVSSGGVSYGFLRIGDGGDIVPNWQTLLLIEDLTFPQFLDPRQSLAGKRFYKPFAEQHIHGRKGKQDIGEIGGTDVETGLPYPHRPFYGTVT